jgi:dihydropteroate synthase
VWGIVNVTPDSFSDGGRHEDTASATAFAQRLRAEGADVLDIGGESTRPGARPVSAHEEIARVVPVIRALREAGDTGAISVDTRHATVADAALGAGAGIVNDVAGGRDPDMFDVVARHGAGLVLMHMRGTPATMQTAPRYDDVVEEVRDWLAARSAAARSRGIDPLWIDPGLGFGKTQEHNLRLLAALDTLSAVGPVLLGASRKSFLGHLTAEPVADRRLAGSLAAVAHGFAAGVAAVRVHDVRMTCQALAVLAAIRDVGLRE